MPVVGILDRKRTDMRDLFCTTLKVLKIYRELFWNIQKLLGEEIPEGDQRGGPKPGGAPYPLGAPLGLVSRLAGLQCPSSAI